MLSLDYGKIKNFWNVITVFYFLKKTLTLIMGVTQCRTLFSSRALFKGFSEQKVFDIIKGFLEQLLRLFEFPS